MRGIKPRVTLAVVGVVGLTLGASAYVDQDRPQDGLGRQPLRR
jgi:hypothetical protein